MDSAPKQERSKKRIQTILETAEAILLEENVDAITIAKISKLSGLKRTSTYKFFQTPDSIKTELVKKYFIECNEDFISNIDNINSQELSVVVLRSVEILYNYFLESKAAQSLILLNSTILPVSREAFNQLAKSVQVFVEKNLNLPEIFNRDGVFRVYTQIIISIFSLNTRESGSLNEVGKIEANRAAYAYMLNWLNQSS